MSAILPTCPTGCDFNPPVVNFDYCAPTVAYGEIKHLYIRAVESSGLTDWTDATEWTGLISNDGTAGGEIRDLVVIASKPEPESNEIEMSLKRKIHPPKKHTITGRIDEVSDENYEMLRTLECGGTWLVWYSTGEYMYGGNDGIEAQIVMNEIIPESTDELVHFAFTVSWESKFAPERIANPLS